MNAAGAGSNFQDRIITLHDLDCPWRPRDLEQRSGSAIRQGNINPEVNIIRYVTAVSYTHLDVYKRQAWGNGIVNSFEQHVLSWEDVAKGIR